MTNIGRLEDAGIGTGIGMGAGTGAGLGAWNRGGAGAGGGGGFGASMTGLLRVATGGAGGAGSRPVAAAGEGAGTARGRSIRPCVCGMAVGPADAAGAGAGVWARVGARVGATAAWLASFRPQYGQKLTQPNKLPAHCLHAVGKASSAAAVLSIGASYRCMPWQAETANASSSARISSSHAPITGYQRSNSASALARSARCSGLASTRETPAAAARCASSPPP